MHRARGWDGIGYHYVIRRDGRIEPGRPIMDVGAHVKGVNRESVGVVWVGGIDEDGKPVDNRTPIQCDVLARLTTGLALTFPQATVKGHRDFSPDLDGDGIIEDWEFMKECPCFDVASWWVRADQRKR